MNHFCKCSKTAWVGTFIPLVLLSFPLFAQRATLLEKRITISTGSMTATKALIALGKQADCSFAYSDDLFDGERMLTLNYRNTPLAAILDGSFGIAPAMIRIQGNVVHIRAVPKPPPTRDNTIQVDTVGISRNFDLDPVVVTGQYRPQSLNKSVYRVEVIDKRQIENMAVTNVGELLKQQLNIEIENQSGLGRSKIRVLGLNSQYVKILMDNIPVAGDENMGSDVDLSTISLDDVERVEIVKGAMGVEYGANSIAGVINIITKRRATKNTDLVLDIQEESVRSEYNLRFDYGAKGRHIQKLNASHNLNESLSIGGSISRDKFNGYWGEYEGAAPTTETTEKRGYNWSPKDSWNGNAYTSYGGKRLSFFYKFNYFTSNLTQYSRRAYGYQLRDEQLLINASINNDYRNIRYNHHFNARGAFWKDANFSLDASLQQNGLKHRRRGINLWDNSVIDPDYDLPGGSRLKATDWQEYSQSSGFYAKGSLVKPLIDSTLDFNIGYEMDNTTGIQAPGMFNDVELGAPVKQTLFTGAGYTSAEWQVSPRVMIRPGFRASFSNKLRMRTNESLTTRYRLNDRHDLRLILGTSTRFPNYEELYMRFVDVVHEYVGNPDLRPEYGQSAELQWGHSSELQPGVHLQTSVSTMFQYIRDRIVNVTYESDRPGVVTGTNTFTNENKYHGLSNQLDAKLVSDRFHFSIAGSLVGYRGSDDASENEYGRLLLNAQANAQATYILPAGFRAALFYRFTGKQPLYVFLPKAPPEPGKVQEYYKILALTDAYNSLDINVAKAFFERKLDVRMGIRNILDVDNIAYTMVDPPAHIVDRNAGIRQLYYGRALFVKLSYQLL